MSGGISKTDEVLLASASDLDTTYGDVTSDLQAMRGQLEQLQAQWTGQGGAAFRGAVTQWQAQADRVLSAMQGFRSGLQAAEQTYDATEADVSGVFARYAAL